MGSHTIAAKPAELGHAVFVGTRDPAAKLARANPDALGNPPFQIRREEHATIAFGSFGEATSHGELVANANPGTVSIEVLKAAGETNLAGKVLIGSKHRENGFVDRAWWSESVSDTPTTTKVSVSC